MSMLLTRSVGADLVTEYADITTRRLMSYAAALGATEDVYLDDMRPEGILGLPTFIVSPEWQVMNGQPYRLALGADDPCMQRCIHVQQDSRFFQPLVSGQQIATTGRVCTLRQTRIGVYVAVRLDTVLVGTGEALAQSWFCGIFLGDHLDGQDNAVGAPPDLAPGTDEPYSVPPSPMLSVSRVLPHLYTEAAAIWNPIHTERRAAREAGLDDILLHGTCTWGAAGLHLIRQFAGGDPCQLRRLGARMVGKALVGAVLSVQYRAIPNPDSAIRCIAFQVVDEKGALILADGIAEFGAYC